MPNRLDLFRGLTISWAVISIVSATGLIFVFTWHQAEHTRVGITFFLTIGLILTSALGIGISWYSLRAPRSQLGKIAGRLRASTRRPGLVLIALFNLAGIIAGILLAVAWINLRLFSQAFSSQLPLLFWLLFTSIATFSFLIYANKEIFSGWRGSIDLRVKDTLPLLLPLMSVILIGKSLNDLLQGALVASHNRYAAIPQFTLALGLVCSLIVVDLILVSSVIFTDQLIQDIQDRWRQITAKIRVFKGRVSFLSRNSTASFFSTLAFFLIFFIFFRPGYVINDDINMLSIASGYLGGQPNPYLVFSNVLLGFFLLPFFQLRSPINWEIILFFVIHFLSTWALLDVIYSRRIKTAIKALAVVFVLVFVAYFSINITFTTTAAIAIIAGFCQVTSALLVHPNQSKLSALISGGGLILLGSLVRFTSLFPILAVGLPILVINYRSINIRKMAVTFLIIGMFVAACYIFDTAYIQSSPDWKSYDLFNKVRSQLLDTPRARNGNQAVYNAIGWTQNDAHVFGGWFFLDPDVFTTEKLQYLVNHVSDARGDTFNTISVLAGVIFSPLILIYVLLFVLTAQVIIKYSPQRVTVTSLIAAATAILTISAYLVLKMKLPARIFLPMLATGLLVILCLLSNPPELQAKPVMTGSLRKFIRKVELASILIGLFVTISLSLIQFFETSTMNGLRQASYKQFVADLNTLQTQGAIRPNSLIVAPMLGFPLEWSNPFTLEYPAIQYLSAGWTTYSPPYQKVLEEFHIQSIPRALYQRDDVYLMTRYDIVPGIIKFIQEHYGVTVAFKKIYTMPANIPVTEILEYQNISIYKLEPQ
ncbi:MAG TPA: hypothetical protein VMS73_02715 [Anaerolineaceae bacterium]|nr:hypothetical protein [Anaerolineaceae bacterium]